MRRSSGVWLSNLRLLRHVMLCSRVCSCITHCALISFKIDCRDSPDRLTTCAVVLAVALPLLLLLLVLACCRDGKPSNSVVLGEVVLFHIADGVAGRSPSGKLVVDPTKLQPVCRLGGVTYGRVTELYDIPRPNISGANAAEATARR